MMSIATALRRPVSKPCQAPLRRERQRRKPWTHLDRTRLPVQESYIGLYFTPRLWSRNSNFRPRLQLRASNFFGSDCRTTWSKKTLHYLQNSLEPEPKFQAPPSKKFWLHLRSSEIAWAPVPQPLQHFWRHQNNASQSRNLRNGNFFIKSLRLSTIFCLYFFLIISRPDDHWVWIFSFSGKAGKRHSARQGRHSQGRDLPERGAHPPTQEHQHVGTGAADHHVTAYLRVAPFNVTCVGRHVGFSWFDPGHILCKLLCSRAFYTWSVLFPFVLCNSRV